MHAFSALCRKSEAEAAVRLRIILAAEHHQQRSKTQVFLFEVFHFSGGLQFYKSSRRERKAERLRPRC
jgi:hypothetical protein